MRKYDQVIDVRRKTEYEADHLDIARNIPLDQLDEYFGHLDKDKDYLLVCKSGYRSSIACSLMKKAGFTNVFNLKGGMDALEMKELVI